MKQAPFDMSEYTSEQLVCIREIIGAEIGRRQPGRNPRFDRAREMLEFREALRNRAALGKDAPPLRILPPEKTPFRKRS